MSSKNNIQDLPNGWQYQKLSSVVTIYSGIALPEIFKNGHNSGDIEFFKVAQMNNHDKYMRDAEITFNKNIQQKNKIKLFPAGSIIFPKRGGAILTNKKRILEKEASYDSNLMGLKANTEWILDKYLFAFISSIDLKNFVDESTIPQINNKHIDRILISFPSDKSEQERIVAKLDALFEKLDEAIKLAEENLEHLSHLLPAALNEVFENAEGKRWNKLPFEKIVNNLDGKRIPIKAGNRDTIQGTYPYYGASGIIDYVDDYIFEGENLLISEDGANLTVRKYPIAFIADGKYWVNNHAHVVSAKKEYTTNKFLEYYFAHIDISAFITGSAQPKLSQKKLNEIIVTLPKPDVQEKIVVYFNELKELKLQLQTHYESKLKHLRSLRASLLDASFKGEL